MTEAVRARVVRARARRHGSRGTPAEGTRKGRNLQRSASFAAHRGRRGERPEPTFGKGLTGALSVNREPRGTRPRHPSRLDGKASQKADRSGSDRRGSTARHRGPTPGASRTDARSRRDPPGNRETTRRTAHPDGYTQSFVVCRFRPRGIGRTAFAGGALGEGRGRREVVLPLHPSRAEVDAKVEVSPSRTSPIFLPPRRSGERGRAEPGAWFVGSSLLKQVRRSGGPTARGDARASCAPAEIGEGDLEWSRARQRWSSCRCPPAEVRRGERCLQRHSPSGSLCTLHDGSPKPPERKRR